MSAFPPSRFDRDDEQGAAWQRPVSEHSAFSDGGSVYGSQAPQYGGHYGSPEANPHPARYGGDVPCSRQYPDGATGHYPGQQQNPYPSPYVRQMPQMYPQKTNTLAIIALVASLLGWFFIAPVLGWAALRQIKYTGDSGAGLAKASIIISVLWGVACLGFLLLWILAGLAMSSY